MSLQHTESFIAYPQVTVPDALTDENIQAINAAKASLIRGGYEVYTKGTAATDASRGGILVRPDPVTAGRAALVHSSPATTLPAAVTGAIRKRFPLTRKPLIGGFSLYIPPEFVKSPAAGRVALFRVFCPVGVSTSTTWQNGTATDEVFRINSDLTVQWYTDAPLSNRSLEPGRMAYLEYSITDTEIRVWLDNVIVLQKSYQLIRESIAFAFEVRAVPAPGTPLTNAAGRWAISNWYNLYDDDIAPTSRLGPATRVIGVRPAVDVDVQFNRPSGVASNATVAAQDLVDSPPRSLQAPAPGAQDIYASNLDTETAAGSLIHGIAVKVMAGSLDAASHTIRPLIRTQIGTEAVQPGARALTTIGTLPGNAVPVDAVTRNTDGALFVITTSGLFVSPDGKGKVWEAVTVPAGIGADGVCIACRNDGMIIVGLKSARGLAWVPPPGSTITPQIRTDVISWVGDVVSLATTPLGYLVVGGTSARVARSNQASQNTGIATGFTGTTLSGGSGNVAAVASNRAGDMLAMTAQTTPNVWRAPAPSYTWAAVNSGTTSFANSALASDGDQIALFTNIVGTSAAWMRRSPDGGLTWTDLISQPNFNVGEFIQGSGPFAKGDGMYNQAGIFVGFNGGQTLYIPQGGTVPYGPAVQASPIKAAAAMPNGTWTLFNARGEVLAFDPQAIDWDLPAFSGFVPSVNISTINPDTGAPWTPAEASVAQFGMRITS